MRYRAVITTKDKRRYLTKRWRTSLVWAMADADKLIAQRKLDVQWVSGHVRHEEEYDGTINHGSSETRLRR